MRITLEVPDSVVKTLCDAISDSSHDSLMPHNVGILLRDAMYEFIGARTPVEAYVKRRYPDMHAAWQDAKVGEVQSRCMAAQVIRLLSHTVKVEMGEEPTSLTDDDIIRLSVEKSVLSAIKAYRNSDTTKHTLRSAHTYVNAVLARAVEEGKIHKIDKGPLSPDSYAFAYTAAPQPTECEE